MDSIIKKLQALLRITTDRGATEGEMQNAMALALRLSLKHKIPLEDVKNMDETETVHLAPNIIQKTFDTNKGRASHPTSYKYLADLLCRYFSVKVMKLDGNKAALVGTEEDVDFALYVFQYLKVTFRKIWEVYKWEEQVGNDKRESFYYGLWQGLRIKLESEKEATIKASGVENQFQLVLVKHDALLNEKLKEFFPGAVQRTNRPRSIDGEVASAGRERGMKININQALPK